MIITICLLAFALGAHSFFEESDDASPSPTSCTYYEYLERRWQCKNTAHSYPLNYGLKYCTIFLEMAKGANPFLRSFLHDTAYCLQRALQQFDLCNEPSAEDCKALEELAFKSHATCYEENGFHKLDGHNQLEVSRHLVDLDLLLKPRFSFTQGMEIGLLCAVNKIKNSRCRVQ